jgi:hypothetical protein
LLSGSQVSNKKDLKLADNIRIFSNPGDLLEFLVEIKENLKYKNPIKSFSQQNNTSNTGL